VLFRVNQASGIPLYVQLMEQVKHALETGALRAGDQLPAIRKVAEDLIMNPNTVVRAYRELQHEGIIELRHGSGAYVSERAAGPARVTRKAQTIVQSALDRLVQLGLTGEEIHRLMENELSQLSNGKLPDGKVEEIKS
jgi:GntR family transcriptional regulator